MWKIQRIIANKTAKVSKSQWKKSFQCRMVIPVLFQILWLVIPEVLMDASAHVMDTSAHMMDTSPQVAKVVCFSSNLLPLTLSVLTGKAGHSFCSFFFFSALCVHKDIYHRSLQFLFSRLNNPTSFNLSF